jgi:hypothetical protein
MRNYPSPSCELHIFVSNRAQPAINRKFSLAQRVLDVLLAFQVRQLVSVSLIVLKRPYSRPGRRYCDDPKHISRDLDSISSIHARKHTEKWEFIRNRKETQIPIRFSRDPKKSNSTDDEERPFKRNGGAHKFVFVCFAFPSCISLTQSPCLGNRIKS